MIFRYRFQNRFSLLTILVFLLVVLYSGSSCSILKRDKQSVAEKKQAEADKKATAEYEKARKRQYNLQTKETKKQMKRTKKSAKKFNKPLRRKGLFNRNCD